MVDVWSEGAAFGELRSLVSKRPGADAFARICTLIDEAEAAAPGLYASRWREYLASHLVSWQPRQCSVRFERREEAEEGAAAPWADLVKGVELYMFDLARAADSRWVAGELREGFPGMVHLGLNNVSVRKAAIVSACKAGVFDGLSSVEFVNSGLRPTTLEVLMVRLEERDELEHLRFLNCSFGVAQFERVFASSLLPRLRSFGLPYHTGFDVDQAKALAELAPTFEALERLDLSLCSLGGAGAKALAEAEWGESFVHLDLNRSNIRGMGIKALADNGLLGSIVEEGGEKTLSLCEQRIGVKALELLVDSGVLEGVVNLNLTDCNLTRFDVFEKFSTLDTLRALYLHKNRWADDEDGAELIDAIDGIDGLERFSITTDTLPTDFMARLLASPGASSLKHIKLGDWNSTRREDLEALLEWDRLPEVEVHACWGLDATDALLEPALTCGRFTRDSPQNERFVRFGAGFRPWTSSDSW